MNTEIMKNKNNKTRVTLDLDEESNRILREVAAKTGLKFIVVFCRALKLAKEKVEKGEIL
jgi:hypothetical protein